MQWNTTRSTVCSHVYLIVFKKTTIQKQCTKLIIAHHSSCPQLFFALGTYRRYVQILRITDTVAWHRTSKSGRFIWHPVLTKQSRCLSIPCSKWIIKPLHLFFLFLFLQRSLRTNQAKAASHTTMIKHFPKTTGCREEVQLVQSLGLHGAEGDTDWAKTRIVLLTKPDLLNFPCDRLSHG